MKQYAYFSPGMEIDLLFPLYSLVRAQRKDAIFPRAVLLLGALSLETNIISLCFLQRTHKDTGFLG